MPFGTTPSRWRVYQFHHQGNNRELGTGNMEPIAPARAGEQGNRFDMSWSPDGTLIGRILLPERCANICFGGKKRNRLFMAASQSVYALYVEAQGVLGG